MKIANQPSPTIDNHNEKFDAQDKSIKQNGR